MEAASVQQKFTAALAVLIEQVKEDRSVLAAILCGSLSHDTVWSKSDIDLVLVTIDDRKVDQSGLELWADGVNVHALLIPRAEFGKIVGSSLHNSFLHSFLTKGRLLYTHDESIASICAGLHEIGERDTQLQLLRAATNALPPIYKAHKWFTTRGDLEYTALWILYAATPLARIEVLSAGQLADREVIPQALRLNPAFFQTIYSDLLNEKKTTQNVKSALDAADLYIVERTPLLFGLVVDHLREVGEARSSREIDAYFERNFGIDGIVTACEFLADQRLIGKASAAIRLTRRSNVDVQELAFFYLKELS